MMAEEPRPAEIPSAATSVRTAIRKTVQESFRYDPSVREKILAAKNLFADVTTMETVVVLQSKEKPGFRAYLEQKRRAAENAKPSVAHGLPLLSLPTVSAGILPYEDQMPFGPSKPRWTLLNLRW